MNYLCDGGVAKPQNQSESPYQRDLVQFTTPNIRKLCGDNEFNNY